MALDGLSDEQRSRAAAITSTEELEQPGFEIGPQQRQAPASRDDGGDADSGARTDSSSHSWSTHPRQRRTSSNDPPPQTGADRRQQARRGFRGLILALLPESEIPCVAGNISASGMLIYPCEQAEPLPPFRVSFRLPNQPQWLQLSGALVRIDVVGDRPVWGLRFIDVPRPLLAHLRRYVALRSADAASTMDHQPEPGATSERHTVPLRGGTTDEMDTNPRTAAPAGDTEQPPPEEIPGGSPVLTLSPLPGLEQPPPRQPQPAAVNEEEATGRFDVSCLERPTADARSRHPAKPPDGVD